MRNRWGLTCPECGVPFQVTAEPGDYVSCPGCGHSALVPTPSPASSEPQPAFDMRAHLQRQREWSERTFGPGDRAKGVVDHIRKELKEIEADPTDLTEWIDVVILALDGAWRSGASPEQIVAALAAKQAKNEARQWPDWRTQPTDKAITHVKSSDPQLATPPAAAGERLDEIRDGLNGLRESIEQLSQDLYTRLNQGDISWDASADITGEFGATGGRFAKLLDELDDICRALDAAREER